MWNTRSAGRYDGKQFYQWLYIYVHGEKNEHRYLKTRKNWQRVLTLTERKFEKFLCSLVNWPYLLIFFFPNSFPMLHSNFSYFFWWFLPVHWQKLLSNNFSYFFFYQWTVEKLRKPHACTMNNIVVCFWSEKFAARYRHWEFVIWLIRQIVNFFFFFVVELATVNINERRGRDNKLSRKTCDFAYRNFWTDLCDSNNENRYLYKSNRHLPSFLYRQNFYRRRF